MHCHPVYWGIVYRRGIISRLSCGLTHSFEKFGLPNHHIVRLWPSLGDLHRCLLLVAIGSGFGLLVDDDSSPILSPAFLADETLFWTWVYVEHLSLGSTDCVPL